MNDAEKFAEWYAENMERLRTKFERYCNNKHYQFDEDILSDTFLKCWEKINLSSLTTATPMGFENYFFKAFQNNVRREAQYARNKNRVPADEAIELEYEQQPDTSMAVVENQAKVDFSALYLLKRIEEEFGEVVMRLCVEKYLMGKTYKQLKNEHKTQQHLRDKVLLAKKWAQENISKEEIDKAFENYTLN